VIVGAITVVAVAAGAVIFVVNQREEARTPEAFCATMEAEQERILEQLEGSVDEAGATGDEFAEALLTLVASLQALTELETYFRRLEAVAPAEIQDDAAFVAEEIGGTLEVPELSFTGMANAVMLAMRLSSPLDRLNAYALENCGRGI
jgi:hypothetical protein